MTVAVSSTHKLAMVAQALIECFEDPEIQKNNVKVGSYNSYEDFYRNT
jgi:hypothetical protein